MHGQVVCPSTFCSRGCGFEFHWRWDSDWTITAQHCTELLLVNLPLSQDIWKTVERNIKLPSHSSICSLNRDWLSSTSCYPKVLSLTQKESDILIYTSLIFNIVHIQRLTVLPSTSWSSNQPSTIAVSSPSSSSSSILWPQKSFTAW